MAKTVAVMLGQGFEPLEVVAPVDALRRGGVEATLVSVMDSKEVKSAQDITMHADVMLDDINLMDFDMIMVPGGSEGVENLKKSPLLMEALKSFMAEGRPVSAICAGPTVLAAADVLEGHKATCYPGCETVFPAGVYVKQPVVEDGNLITSEGPGTALRFGIAVLGSIMGKQVADEVAAGMLVNE